MKRKEILNKLTQWECPDCGGGMEYNDKHAIQVENWSCQECGRQWRIHFSVTDFERLGINEVHFNQVDPHLKQEDESGE